MKRFLLLAALALGALAGAQNAPVGAQNAPVGAQNAPVGAQNAPAPKLAPALQTDAAAILTPDFIRFCTYIGRGTLTLKKSGAQMLGEFPGQHQTFKGLDDLVMQGFGLGNAVNLKSGDKAIFFAHYEAAQKRAVIIGRLPATEANIARVKALVAQVPDFEISFATDKEQYALGEAIKVTWRFKNVSPLARSLFVGLGSLTVDLVYDNHGTSSEDTKLRQVQPLVLVQPGQTWTYERTFQDTFPVGTLELWWAYAPNQAVELVAVLPTDIALLGEQGKLAVTILPAGQAQVQALDAGLKSPLWNEQLAAAQKLLQSDDPENWKKLEPLASHPMREIREIAEKAMARGGAFSPALKALLYASTPIEAASFPQAPREGGGDFALALLARASVEEEARDRGFKGPQPKVANAERAYSPLDFNGDPRIGDLLAARLRRGRPMEGGVNNGLTLLSLAGLRDQVQDADKPLPEALGAKVLAAWDAQRAQVKDPFTQEQLDAEIAAARRIRYASFKTGPFYAEVAALIDEGRARNFNASQEQDVWDKKLLALPKEAAPDLLSVLKWREIVSLPRSVLRFLANSGQPEVFGLLTQIAYGEGWPEGDARIEAIRLMAQLDFGRAQPHIENFLILPYEKGDWSREAPRMGAAIALAAHGDKRGVPIIFSAEYEGRFGILDEASVGAALKAATGQDFPNLTQWKQWWQREGQKMEWK